MAHLKEFIHLDVVAEKAPFCFLIEPSQIEEITEMRLDGELIARRYILKNGWIAFIEQSTMDTWIVRPTDIWNAIARATSKLDAVLPVNR